MTELNKYSFYGLNYMNAKKMDELDSFVNNIVHIKEYAQVKDFLENKWHGIEGKKRIKYPVLDKTVYVNIADDRIEVRIFKNDKQDFGQYWQLVSSNEE